MNLQTQPLAQMSPHKETLIRETRLLVAGLDAYYRLFERGSHFWIEISFGAELSRSDVGKSFSRAAHLYELLVEGEVTPCTVQDILEDLALA